MDMLIMDKFIQRENLAHFKKLIAEAKDESGVRWHLLKCRLDFD